MRHRQTLRRGGGRFAVETLENRRLLAGDITGVVFLDAQINRVQDPGEAGIADVTVYLDTNGSLSLDPGELSTVTAGDGGFAFHGLAPGTYHVTAIPPTGYLTRPNEPTEVTGLVTSATVLIGLHQPAPASGVVFNDRNGNGVRDAGEEGLAGIMIGSGPYQIPNFDQMFFTSRSDGSLLIPDAIGTVGNVRGLAAIPPGWHATTPTSINLSLTSGQSLAALNFGIAQDNPATGSIAALWFDDANGDGVGQWSETLASTATVYLDLNKNGLLDSGEPQGAMVSFPYNGWYMFSGLAPGNYLVREVPPAGVASPQSQLVSVSANYQSQVNFVSAPGSISGKFYSDLNGNGTKDNSEPGLSNFIAYIDANNNKKLDTGEIGSLSDASGTFTFQNLQAGAYVVREVAQTGWKQTSASAITVAVKAGQVSSPSFGDQQTTSQIGGTVFNDLNASATLDPNDTLLAGVRVFLDLNKNGTADATEPSVLTDSAGRFTFTGLAAGAYRVTEVTPKGLAPFNVSDKYNDVTVGANQVATSNFSDIKLAAAVSFAGTIFNDINGDRVQQSNEPGLANWRVYIDANLNAKFDPGEPVAYTNSAGVYTLKNVATGRYLIRPDDPATWSTGNYLAWYASSAGQNAGGFNFAATHKAVLGGQIFVDLNGNGKLDANETLASGLEVYIDANNNGKLDAGEKYVVSNSGTFTILGVTPGKKVLRIVPQTAYKLTTPGAITLTLVQGQLVFNENFGVQIVG